MVYNIIFALLLVGLLPPAYATLDRDNAPTVSQKNCSYAGRKITCYEVVASWNTLGITSDGTFVVAKIGDNLPSPTEDMAVERPQSAKEYFARYGFPEYLTDQRLWVGKLKRILKHWSVEIVNGTEVTSPIDYFLEVENQVSGDRASAISLWSAKPEKNK